MIRIGGILAGIAVVVALIKIVFTVIKDGRAKKIVASSSGAWELNRSSKGLAEMRQTTDVRQKAEEKRKELLATSGGDVSKVANQLASQEKMARREASAAGIREVRARRKSF
jgi:hypothetical protein